MSHNSDVSQDSSSDHSVALIKDQQTEKSTDKEVDSGISIYSIDPINDIDTIKIVNHDYTDKYNVFDPTDLSTMIPDDTPFLLDLWNKTKHICSLCLCFVGCLIVIYLLFIIFSGGIQTGESTIDSTGILDTPDIVKLE